MTKQFKDAENIYVGHAWTCQPFDNNEWKILPTTFYQVSSEEKTFEEAVEDCSGRGIEVYGEDQKAGLASIGVYGGENAAWYKMEGISTF